MELLVPPTDERGFLGGAPPSERERPWFYLAGVLLLNDIGLLLLCVAAAVEFWNYVPTQYWGDARIYSAVRTRDLAILLAIPFAAHPILALLLRRRPRLQLWRFRLHILQYSLLLGVVVGSIASFSYSSLMHDYLFIWMPFIALATALVVAVLEWLRMRWNGLRGLVIQVFLVVLCTALFLLAYGFQQLALFVVPRIDTPRALSLRINPYPPELLVRGLKSPSKAVQLATIEKVASTFNFGGTRIEDQKLREAMIAYLEGLSDEEFVETTRWVDLALMTLRAYRKDGEVRVSQFYHGRKLPASEWIRASGQLIAPRFTAEENRWGAEQLYAAYLEHVAIEQPTPDDLWRYHVGNVLPVMLWRGDDVCIQLSELGLLQPHENLSLARSSLRTVFIEEFVESLYDREPYEGLEVKLQAAHDAPELAGLVGEFLTMPEDEMDFEFPDLVSNLIEERHAIPPPYQQIVDDHLQSASETGPFPWLLHARVAKYGGFAAPQYLLPLYETALQIPEQDLELAARIMPYIRTLDNSQPMVEGEALCEEFDAAEVERFDYLLARLLFIAAVEESILGASTALSSPVYWLDFELGSCGREGEYWEVDLLLQLLPSGVQGDGDIHSAEQEP